MDKNKRILTYVIVLIVLAIGVTFAYFVAQTGDGAKSNVNIKADSVDDLKFSVDKDLSLSANQFNFAQGSGNLSDSVTAKASLKANSTKSTATYNYYVYFQMESNEYKYTTENKLPEIVLSITGPNGEITSVDGLTYVSASDADGTQVKGFDITELGSSIIKIADSFEISSSSSTNYTNQEWVFRVTFINLNADQTDNEGKTMTGKVLIQEDKLVTSVADVANSGDTLTTAVETLGIKGLSSITGLYHHDVSLTNGAEDNSYRFAGANPNNYVCFGSDEATCPYENLYRIIGVIDGKIKLILADGGTIDMLGTDGGYFDPYKTYWDSRLDDNNQRYTYSYSYYKGSADLSQVGFYVWSEDRTSTWNSSDTNTTNLSKNYLSYLDGKSSKWKTMIDDTIWYIGGMTLDNGAEINAKTAYDYEVGTNKVANTTVTSKIGLMYVSDYYYAALPEYWLLPGVDNSSKNDYRKAYNDNWMSMGLFEYTISQLFTLSSPSQSSLVFRLTDDGAVYYDSKAGLGNALRPTFNLTASVQYDSGSGTASDPIRLKI